MILNRKLTAALCLLAVISCIVPPDAAPAGKIKRIVLRAPSDSRNIDRGDHITPLAARYLQERLAQCPSIRIISDKRAAALLSEISSGIRDVPDDKIVAVFSEFIPIYAVIRVRFADSQLKIFIYTSDGTRTLVYKSIGTGQRQKTIHRAAADVAKALKLTPTETAILTKPILPNDEIFHGYYFSRIIGARWPNNPAEGRIELLRTLFHKYSDSIPLATRAVEDAGYFFRASNRAQDFAKPAIALATFALPLVLGTESESSAYEIATLKPEVFEEDLLKMAQALIADDVEDVMDDIIGGDDDGDELGGMDMNAGALDRVGNATDAQRLGAIRTLGAMGSKRGIKLAINAASHEKPDIRTAAATALSLAEGKLNELERLADDKIASVAFEAVYGLWKKERPHPRQIDLTLNVLKSNDARTKLMGAEIIASLSDIAVQQALRSLTSSNIPELRYHGFAGLLKQDACDKEELLALLDNADERILISAIANTPKHKTDALSKKLMNMANEPHAPVAQAARLALASFRPSEPDAIDAFDLATEHTYIRQKILDRSSVAVIKHECANQDPHTRAHALKLLTEKSVTTARPVLATAIADPYRWVRLHASALMARHATLREAKAIKSALSIEQDPAITLYLEDALAVAEGRPLPDPPVAARSVKAHKNLTWICGLDPDAANSPFMAHYVLNVDVNDSWKEYYKSGKIFFGRASPVGNSGLIITDPVWRNRFWLSLNGQLTTNNLPYLDGVVYGEETMKLSASPLWPTGWRLFCLDARIDPARIDGKLDNLNTFEKRAWNHWALEKCIDGFNMLYDYTKLRQGKLRPGLQVATFLPGEATITPADKRWKFDVAGIYDYKGCNRIAAYMLPRRIKTIWPDRTIIWLSLGIGGYEMNPVKYSTKTPSQPMVARYRRCYADTISAWLAGADPGWFSTWIFVKHDFKGGMADLSGVQIHPGDIFANHKLIKKGIGFSFNGVKEVYDMQNLKQPEVRDEFKAGDGFDDFALDDPDEKEDPLEKRIEEEKARMFDGFQFYGKYVYDCARVFSDLPRLNYTSQALAIRPGISVWTRGSNYPLIPGFALLPKMDFLCAINKTADMDLSKYKLIATHNPGLFTDATINALSSWIRESPGLLYVHRYITHDNASEASSPDDHDGKLQNDWPWEADVQITQRPAAKRTRSKKKKPITLTNAGGGELKLKNASVAATFAAIGKNASVLLRHKGDPVLVLWQKPDHKGAVIFDGIENCSREYLDFLAATMNELESKEGVGMKIRGPFLYQALATKNLKAIAKSPYYRGASKAKRYGGVDLLTGEKSPTVGPGRSGTIIAKDLQGKYVASHGGISILSETPIKSIKKIDGGLEILSTGLTRAGSVSGVVSVRKATGESLPTIEDMPPWIIRGTKEGVALMPIGKNGANGTVAFVRSKSPVQFTVK